MRKRNTFAVLVTVRAMVALWLSVPLVPVTVTLKVPAAAVLDALKVTVLVPVVETGLKLAVTPAGRPLAASATAPLKPFTGLTMIVLLPFAPCATERVAGLAVKEKSGCGVPVTVKLTALLVTPLTETVTFTAPAAILGTVTLSEVELAAVTMPVAVPNLTVLAFAVALKFVPVMVMDAPGAADVGLIELMVGAVEPPPRGN